MRRCEELTRALERLGCSVDSKFTERRGHAIEIADAAARSQNYESVVAVGGDGTLREVSEGLDARLPVGVFPSGTANVVGRELGIPFHAEGAARVLAQGRVAPIDTALCNGRRALFVVGAGFDAQILLELERARRGGISYMSYLRPIITTLRNYRPAPIRVSVDGAAPLNCGFLIISNTRYYAGPWIRFRPGPRTDDGLFEVYRFNVRSISSLFGSLLRGVAGRLPGGNVICTKGRNIIVQSDVPVPIQIDGDTAGSTPASIEIRTRSVPILVP